MILALALSLAVLCAQGGEAHEVARLSQGGRRECEVRAWALSPQLAAPSFRAALASEDWRKRHAALDALARARPGALAAPELAFVADFLEDVQPNVRAAALEVCARFALPLPAGARRLARDPFPEVRRQYVRAIARTRAADLSAQLEALAHDGDERVAWEAACAWLVSRGSRASDGAWSAGLVEGEFRDFARAVDALARDGPPAALARALRHLRGLSERGRFSFLLATLAARVPLFHERSAWSEAPADDEELWGELVVWPAAGGVSPLVELWLVPFGPAASFAEREGRSRLLEVAASGWFSPESAWALLGRAVELDARGPEDLDAAWDATRCLEGVHAAVAGNRAVARHERPEWVSHLARTGLAGGGRMAWSEDFALEFWEGLEGAAASFSSEDLDGWLAPTIAVSVRRVATEVFADAWRRAADPGAAALLGLALEDADEAVQHEALLALVGDSTGVLAEHRSVERAAFAVWNALPLEQKLSDLRGFRRGARFDSPWREEFVRLWASGEGRVVSIPELLAKLEGDREVVAVLARWLRDELVRLEADEVPDVQTTRGSWREIETHARWLLEAWTRASEHRTFEEARALLLRVDPLGKELTKLLVASLARTRDGGELLAELFEHGGLSRRARIEIALLVPQLEREAARRLLLASYVSCDEELRLRILERLGELAGDGARGLLTAVVLDASSTASEAVVALDALAAAGRAAEVRPQLERVFARSDDLDRRRAAIRALGAVGDAGTRELLMQALDLDEHIEFLRDELLPALVRIELRAEGVLSARLHGLWCAAAGERAARELELRFRGERLPNPGFIYSDTLGAAQVLAARGQLRAALPTGWEAWDARLLLLLAEVAANGGGDGRGPRGLVRDLNHAALVGLRGEADAPDRDGLVLRARSRLLELALVAGDWRDVEGWAELILEDWRTSRTTPGAFRAVYGARDPWQEQAPTSWLRATRAQARARLALERGGLDEARAQFLEAAYFAPESGPAQRQQQALEGALRAAGVDLPR